MNTLKRIKLDRLARARLDPELVKAERHFIKAWENVDIGDYVIIDTSTVPWEQKLYEYRVLTFVKGEEWIEKVQIYDILLHEHRWVYQDEVLYCIRKRY